MKKYSYPEIEIIKVSAEDVITGSGDVPGGDNKGDGGSLNPGEWWGNGF